MFKTIDSETSEGICAFCNGDSFKFKEGGRWMFLCHNCQRYMPFDRTGIKEELATQQITNFDSIMSLCQPVDTLDASSRFRRYAEGRKIPLNRIYYTNQFDVISTFSGTPVADKERLILPFFKENGELFGIQGRSLDKDQIRYITLMFDKHHPKLFGLDKIDPQNTITIVEGPIDSLFLKNSLAMAGSDANLNKYLTNSIIAFDNEPRNYQIVSKMAKFIDNGFKVVIWPEAIREKDVNDMFLAGYDVDSVVHSNVYSGLTGKIKLNQWKKV
jgi:hypothetical protein